MTRKANIDTNVGLKTSKFYYNTGFRYETNDVHCGMAQDKQTWKSPRQRHKSPINKFINK